MYFKGAVQPFHGRRRVSLRRTWSMPALYYAEPRADNYQWRRGSQNDHSQRMPVTNVSASTMNLVCIKMHSEMKKGPRNLKWQAQRGPRFIWASHLLWGGLKAPPEVSPTKSLREMHKMWGSTAISKQPSAREGQNEGGRQWGLLQRQEAECSQW